MNEWREKGFNLYGCAFIGVAVFLSITHTHVRTRGSSSYIYFYIYVVIAYINWVIVYINMSETQNLVKIIKLKIVNVYNNSVFVDINYSWAVVIVFLV